MKDGDEKTVEAELVFAYGESDESVGIYGGFSLAGLRVFGKFLELREVSDDGERCPTFYVEAAQEFDRIAADLAESHLERDDD